MVDPLARLEAAKAAELAARIELFEARLATSCDPEECGWLREGLAFLIELAANRAYLPPIVASPYAATLH